MEFYVQKLNFDHWINICGPFGTEREAYNYACGCKNNSIHGKRLRIATAEGRVVDILM
jgi:hypothetical protein